MRCKEILTDVESADTPAGLSLRPAAASDLGPLVALDRLCFGRRAWPGPEWWEAITEPGWTTLVARRGDRIVGAVVLLLWPPVASLASIAVHPDERGHGVGAWLLGDALTRARAATARWLTLEVDATNETAVRLYRSRGFALTRRFREDNRRRYEMAHRLGRRLPGRRDRSRLP
jgi:ribosomal-protein-alanine N-acetyltransferase